VLAAACDWLAHTTPSRFIQDVPWIVPGVQTVHLLAIAVLFCGAAMLNVRILANAPGIDPEATARRFLPWIWSGLAALLTSGLVLVVGEPARELLNEVFWAKMLLIAAALLATLAMVRAGGGASGQLAMHVRASLAQRALAGLALALWLAVITAGRWIAYTGGNA
jgi:hypothetical protein